MAMYGKRLDDYPHLKNRSYYNRALSMRSPPPRYPSRERYRRYERSYSPRYRYYRDLSPYYYRGRSLSPRYEYHLSRGGSDRGRLRYPYRRYEFEYARSRDRYRGYSRERYP